MRFVFKFFRSLATSICITGMCIISPAYAQDLQTALDRAGKAYAVHKLEKADTIRLEAEFRLPFNSHDYSTDFHDLARQRYHTILDIKNQQGSHEFLTEISRTSYHGRSLVKDGQSIHINYGPDTWQDNGEADFMTAFGSTFRASDVLLAFWMLRSETKARYTGDAMWLGYSHDIIEIDFPGSPPLEVFVRRNDGAITKMERTFPDERVVYYTFHKHEKSSGILIAREHSFYVENEPIYFSFNRAIELNDRRDRRAFQIDKGIVFEPERNDQSEMSVRLVSKNNNSGQLVHQVGQGENCTTFMVVKDVVIGFGLGAGFRERLDAYRQETGIQLPLHYIIAADHHDEDIGGAIAATEAGAILMVTAPTAKKLNSISTEHNLEIVTKDKHIANIVIMPIATDHAASALMVYHKTQKLVMQTGHYYSSFISGPSYARRTAVSFYEAIPDTIRLETPMILSGQDIKPENWSDFVSAIKNFQDIHCHRNRPICKSGAPAY